MGGVRLKLFFDGGCRPNPGRIEAAVVVQGMTHFFDDLGEGTNEDAEWLALLRALEVGQALSGGAFDLVGDCAHVIDQANGAAKCRGERARAYLAQFRERAEAAPPRRVRWVARTQNLAGIALERRRGGFRFPVSLRRGGCAAGPNS
ncbi:MAG TPA: reverse transcriptase-like protein [Allosphingosinicella sp.]|jgi:ribonuclease HI